MRNRVAFSFALAVSLGLNIAHPSSVSACSEVAHDEQPALESRTYRNARFGFLVDIPSNYRTIAMQSGIVHVASPGGYASIQCMLRQRYGSGGWFSSFIIESQPVSNPGLSLEQLVRSQAASNGSSTQVLTTQIGDHAAVKYVDENFYDGINVLNIAFLSKDGRHLITISGPEDGVVLQRAIRTFRFE